MSKNNMHTQQPSACIVVPVHKKFVNLSEYEVLSLTQCVKVLHDYPVFFAGPDSIDWSGYEEFCTRNGISFKSRNFSNHFFATPQGYNKLLITPAFYHAFTDFEHMLLFQTDCFIFKNELAEWCRQGYDYIGAPWVGADMFRWFLNPGHPKELVNVHRFFKNRFIRRTGNGGLSLRNIKNLLRNLERFHNAAEHWPGFEDSFISHYIGTFNPFFRIPGLKTALRFSFDTNPAKAYALNHNQLPFACHAWFRNEKPHYEHNLAFWEPIIKSHMV